MKKIYTLLIAIAFSVCVIVAIDCMAKSNLDKNVDKTLYYNVDERNSYDDLMDKIITEDSVLVLGSSELSSSDNLAYPEALFNKGYSDFNMILVGTGHVQSLQHAINAGAFQNNIKNGKIVLILSPQWFTESHLPSEAFASHFDESMYVEFLRNNDISKETKTAISNRVNELLKEYPVELNRVNDYESIYLYHGMNPVKRFDMFCYRLFRDAKRRFELTDGLKDVDDTIDYDKYVTVEDIDFNLLLEEAEAIGKESCTNNEYGIYDDYFNTYILDNYAAYANSSTGEHYTTSIEYDDLRLFLDVCKEMGLEPLIISVPVNGRWYDYTGFSYDDRQQYYQNIRNICEEYAVEIADFSDKEYEMYFLRDVMHLGWKGWVYLDEAVYNFYKEE